MLEAERYRGNSYGVRHERGWGRNRECVGTDVGEETSNVRYSEADLRRRLSVFNGASGARGGGSDVRRQEQETTWTAALVKEFLGYGRE